MIRFISIEKNDILNDPEEAAEILSHATERKIPMKFMGLHADPAAPELTVFMEESEESEPATFVFSPIYSDSREDMIALVTQRYEAEYATLATFQIAESRWGLFVKQNR